MKLDWEPEGLDWTRVRKGQEQAETGTAARRLK